MEAREVICFSNDSAKMWFSQKQMLNDVYQLAKVGAKEPMLSEKTIIHNSFTNRSQYCYSSIVAASSGPDHLKKMTFLDEKLKPTCLSLKNIKN